MEVKKRGAFSEVAPFFSVPSMWGCESPIQPDSGEVLAKRKSCVARHGLKEACSKAATRWTRTEYEACAAGRASQ